MGPITIGAATFLITALLIAGCASKPTHQIFLMPAPDVYIDGQIDPFIDNDPISRGVQPSILYATDRAPATEDEKKKNPFYSDERGGVLRLGLAETEFGLDEEITWEEARRISLLKNRTDQYPIELSKVSEFGVLAESIDAFDGNVEPDDEPGRRFAEEINRRLAISHTKDVYIYVHGYKVAFENPVLVAAELWHFLGYNGAFIAYSWPSTPKTLAYFEDLDDAINSARYLRTLILYIADHTDAEKIHVLGYSAGTRAVTRMLADFGMYGWFMDKEAIDRKLKLGNIIVVGSDVDRQILGGYLIDGALRIPEAITIYQSSGDSALGLSKWVFGRNRAGQVVDEGPIDPKIVEFFDEHPSLRLVDVTDAEGSTSGNGHSYFRTSPWVSSDVLMTLMYNLAPADRGLVMSEKGPIWTYPADYVEKLRQALGRVNPALGVGATAEQ
jgi:esterase/lipase superfamily enzyme